VLTAVSLRHTPCYPSGLALSSRLASSAICPLRLEGDCVVTRVCPALRVLCRLIVFSYSKHMSWCGLAGRVPHPEHWATCNTVACWLSAGVVCIRLTAVHYRCHDTMLYSEVDRVCREAFVASLHSTCLQRLG
jgi:hypothetical protein